MATMNDAGLPSITSILPIPTKSVESAATLHSSSGSPRQKTEESASQSLHALVQVEEQRTRQENLKLDQRKVEQSMLREVLDAGVPPHLIPLIFVGNDGASIQAYAAILEHTSQESALPDRLIPHSQMAATHYAASSVRPCQMQSASFSQPRYPSPPATAKGRAYSVFDNSQKTAVRNRSYSFVDTGRNMSAASMAPPINDRNSQYSRSSFMTRPQYFEQSYRPQPQGQSRQSSLEPYALQRQAVTSSAARSYSVSDAGNKYFSGAKRVPTSAATQPRAINFCHWKPPSETNESSEGPRTSLNSVQQSTVNHNCDGGEMPSHTGKRKASYETGHEGPSPYKRSMRQSNSSRDIRRHGFELVDTSSRRRDSLTGIDERCSAEGMQSPRISDTGSNLHVNTPYTDTVPKSPRSKPFGQESGFLPNRKQQEKPEAAAGKMNIRFVDGLTPRKSLPHTRNYVLDTPAPQTGTTNRTTSNGSQRPQQFAFITGHAMTGVGGSSPLVNSALHDMSARRGSMPV